jgi:mannitol-1-/sugar-/sorbitol-6-phosphatase
MRIPGRAYAAFLFDMDGTLINSIAAANQVWTEWANAHGLEPEGVLRIMHGVRAIDTIRRLNVPGIDVEREAELLTQAEIAAMDGIVPIKGALALLRSLPADRWAVVTSAPRALATRRLEVAGVPRPRVLVTAEDVTQGKPSPDAYLLAARQLDVDARDCLVWEDAQAGISAAEAAGADVIVISATHDEPMQIHHPVVVDYDGMTATVDGDGMLVLNSCGSALPAGR